ncbi:unnamed protein product [Hermetia illucens]|uniref:Uncharacterized protein n=1 Tax=Hermetia illucens TaxID=343691 RepID=A0A7R8UIW3_HERIL|nr:unnamed protein product [Hermetia illucens]
MWNPRVFASVASVLLCFVSASQAQKFVYIYDPPGAESQTYAQSYPGRVKVLPPRSVSQHLQGPFQAPEEGVKIVTPDAIRIIDPPKYLREPNREQQYNSPQQFSENKNPFAYGSTFKGPSYLPLPKQTVKSEHVQTLQHSVPYRGYHGGQNPMQEIIRGQIGNLKDKQKIYFQTQDDEHPVRTKYRIKPVVEDEPIYGQSAFKHNKQNYRAGKDEFVVGNTFVVADNAGSPNPPSQVQPFAPYKLLASVRHQGNIRHQPREPLNPRIKERVRTQKAHTVLSEQGYDDRQFDQEDKRSYIAHIPKQRRKREAKEFVMAREVERMEELPIALSLVSDKGQKLVGQDLLKHIADLIQDSKHLIPQKPENGSSHGGELDSIVIPSKGFQELYEKSVKAQQPSLFEQGRPSNHQPQQPIYLNPNVPRAEKLQGFIESPYQRSKAINCDPGQDSQQNGKKKKVGQQIECLKEKYFGKEPLDDKFLREQGVATLKQTVSSGKNPSLLVYTDVMQTIESSRTAKSPRNEGSQFGLDQNPETAAYPEAALPIFDITKYFPQVYMIKPSGKVYGISFKKQAVPVELKPGAYQQKPDVYQQKPDVYQANNLAEFPKSQPAKFSSEVSHQAPESDDGQKYQEQIQHHVEDYAEPHYQQRIQQQKQPKPQKQPQRQYQPNLDHIRQQLLQAQHSQYQKPQKPQQYHQSNQEQVRQPQRVNHHHQYQVQHHIVQQHPVNQKSRRPELINYQSFGNKQVQYVQQHPVPGNQQGGGAIPVHVVKFNPEDAIRPPQHKQRYN